MRLILLVFLVVSLFSVVPTQGYKEYLFKTCSRSGFCSRNRRYGQNVLKPGETEPQYWIDGSTMEVDEKKFIVRGKMVKKMTEKVDLNSEGVVLPVEILLIQGNAVRIKIDEDRSLAQSENDNVNTKRYDETGQWAFADSELDYELTANVKYKLDQAQISFKYGQNQEYEAQVQFHPYQVKVWYQDEVQFVVNEQQFLNYEHWRPEKDNHLHLGELESDYNMFHDDFPDAVNDKIPLGPESVALDFTFKNSKHVYGIPEHADSLDLKDTTDSDLPYRLFNVDIFEYETDSRMPMYGSIPLMVSLKADVSVGLFWVNSADTFIDIDKKSSESDTRTHWMSENGVLDFIIMIGEKPLDINKSYGAITGNVQLPPMFSLGYHQCRWNYNDEKDVLEINSLFDEHQIPYDTIWLDVEYADEKKYFTWQSQKFPDPEGMLKELDHTGRNLVVIIDTHLKKGYSVSDYIQKHEVTIKNPNNKTFEGQCWPGESVWIDTMNPNAQPVWDKQFEFSLANSFMGRFATNIHIWNDMNEPSVFDGIETTSPKSNLHYGNWEHRSVHNVFGLTFHEETFDSMLKRLRSTDRQRPFILTRSFFAGSQRTAAMWTGDNMSKWEYLKASVPMVLTAGVVNMPFAGADVGGFFGNPSKELLTRWYQTGIWYPFFRAHAHIDSRRREPWVPGDPYTSIIRDAIRLRYSLLPTWYTAFHDSNTNGLPILKPMFYENRQEPEVYTIDDQFFLGDSGILVKPVTEEGSDKVDIYLPDTERYYDFFNGNISNQVYKLEKPGYVSKLADLDDIPMLLKGGSIVARKERYRRSSRLMSNDPYTLTVALDKDGHAKGSIYIDDGQTYSYLDGESITVQLQATRLSIKSTVVGSEKFALAMKSIKIEKILILQAADVSLVEVNQNNQSTEPRHSLQQGNLIIENPGLSIGYNWEVTMNLGDGKFISSDSDEFSTLENVLAYISQYSFSSLFAVLVVFIFFTRRT